MAEERKASPLEAIADIFEKVDKYVGIIAAVIAALTFSQGNRIVSYAFVIVGWFLIASFLWRVIAQKSVVKRLIPTRRPLPEKREYVYSRSQRWIAGTALFVLTLFSFGWVGVNGWQDYQAWRQAREGLLFPKAKEGELLVIIAQFDNRSTKGIDPTQRIYDRLCKELEEAGITNARLEIAPQITDLDDAREIGERHGAIFVIWGWFDDVGFTPNFTIVKEKVLAFMTVEFEEVAVGPPRDFGFYIQEGLPAQMAYLSTLTIGQVYYWDDKFEEALSAFDRVIENAQQFGIFEGLAVVYFYRGYIHEVVLNDSQQAIADYDSAIKLKPDLAEAYNDRGTAYAHRDNYHLALADYDKAIELKPGYAMAYYNCGIIYAHKGEYARAIADYNRAIELKPDYAETYNNRGSAYRNKGEHDLAIADYDNAIELRPDLAEAYYNRGNTYLNKGKFDLAIIDYDQAIELKLDWPQVYNNRGNAYRNKGEYDLAIADYNRAIELKLDYAKAYYNRGLAHKITDEKEKAIKDFERFLELSEDEDWRKEAEEHLRELREQ
jgi:tetratricopeptide (TPR) repeat protein